MVLENQIIQTKFLAGQGLGNQLWVYAAGRALAEKLGRRHVVLGMDLFKGSNFLDIDASMDPDEGAPIEQFNEALYYDPSLKYFSSTYDCRVEFLPSRVQVNGLFQSEQYFYGLIDKLPSWIRPAKYVQEMAAKYSDVCVLNLRGGEYKRHRSFILPRSYWDMAVKVLRRRFGGSRIMVVTDDPAYARAFLPEFPVLEGGIIDCYAALMGAKALAVSNSSFSYFPIKTRNDAPFVVAPEHWARYGHAEGRWAMPSNVYKGWNYLSTKGALLEYSDCLKAAAEDAKYYETTFNVRVHQNMVANFSLTQLIPVNFKRPLKRAASYLFPRRFG
jgi:hypothetical protein